MKKLLVSILAILYLATASGATLHLHFCMGKLVGASLYEEAGSKCGHCGMKKKAGKDCCKNECKIVKADDAHLLAATVSAPALHPIAILDKPYFQKYCAPAYSLSADKIVLSHSPPLWRSCPIYISIRNFRI